LAYYILALNIFALLRTSIITGTRFFFGKGFDLAAGIKLASF